MNYACSIKDLLVATTMVAMGLAAVTIVLQSPETGTLPLPLLTGLWVSGPALVGAGLLRPFRLAMIGAIVGLYGQAQFTLGFFCWVYG
jgi:hypothetical protein